MRAFLFQRLKETWKLLLVLWLIIAPLFLWAMWQHNADEKFCRERGYAHYFRGWEGRRCYNEVYMP